ncbi:MAG TPA: hypothetical protein DDW20_00255 [Firmicutes bacterium]|nr:hypothetical protein [Bacillota bacterium]
MRINVNQLSKKPLELEEEISIPESFKCVFPLVSVNKLIAKIHTSSYEDFVDVFLEIKADVILKSVYSLNDFPETITAKEEYHFGSSYDDDDTDMININSNIINMDEYVLNLLSASIPVSPKIKGEKLPSSGEGYVVMSEEEYDKSRDEKYDSRFDKLKDLDLD